MKYHVLCYVLLLLFVLPLNARAADLPTTPVRYAVKERALAASARDLEMLLGVGIKLELNLETLSGNWGGRTGALFLNELARDLKADWYFDNDHVHFTLLTKRKKWRAKFHNEFQAGSFLRLLRQDAWAGSGLSADARASGAVVVAGPPWWVARARNLERIFDKEHTRIVSVDPDASIGIMMFGLRHAWADSKSLKFGDKEIKVPGVVQLLQEIVNDKSHPSPTPASGSRTQSLAPSTFVEITADIRLNAVLIRDAISNFHYYHSIIGGLDTPAKMVMLDAYILDISKNKLKDFGVDWQAKVGKTSVGFGAPGAPQPQSLNFNFGTGAALASMLIDSGVLARARFLQSTGEGTIVSVPSVLTLDNQEAIFSTTETFYARVSGEKVAELIPVKAETELRVTPHILVDRASDAPAVQLLISIKDGSIDNSEQALVDALPRVVTHYLTTQAIVRRGESLVVGGQVVHRDIRSQARVPILSSIPLIGLMFRHRKEERREYVRLFIIRPRFSPNI